MVRPICGCHAGEDGWMNKQESRFLESNPTSWTDKRLLQEERFSHTGADIVSRNQQQSRCDTKCKATQDAKRSHTGRDATELATGV